MPASQFPKPMTGKRRWRSILLMVAGILLTLLAAPSAASAAGTQYVIWPANGYGSSPQKCLDVTGGSTKSGIAIEQYTCAKGTNQRWYIEPTNSNPRLWIIRSVSSDRCLNVKGGTLANSLPIIVYNVCTEANATPNELWYMQPTNEQAGDGADYYQIVNSQSLGTSSRKCLNVKGAGPWPSGTPIIQYTCSSSTDPAPNDIFTWAPY